MFYLININDEIKNIYFSSTDVIKIDEILNKNIYLKIINYDYYLFDTFI